MKKEGFHIEKATRPCAISESFTEYEDPTICEAMQIVCSAGYFISMEMSRFNERKARLKEKYGNNHIKGDFSKNKSIEHCGEPGPGEEQPKEDNPALKEAASQFNDALLDEQRKKIAAYKKLHFYDAKMIQRKDEIIEELRDKNAELLGMVERMKEDVKKIDTNLNAANETNKCLNKKVVELTKIKGDLNSWISGLYFCIHHNNDNYKYKLKRLGKEISKLNSIIHDKNAVLSDVAEELRLSKIREKNLAELGLKYVGENEKLKKELADKIVNEIDARALKSAESALAEKDEVIADLGKELKAQKDLVDDISLKYDGAKHNLKLRIDECEKLKKQLDSNAKMIQKMAEIIVCKKPVTVDLIDKCWILAYSEEKEAAEELSKVLNDVIEFMSVKSKQLFEGDGIPTKMEVMKPSRKFKKIK